MKSNEKLKVPILVKGIIVILVCFPLYICFSIVSFLGHQGREPYAGVVLHEVCSYFEAGLYYVDHFPKDEDEVLKMFEIVKQKEPIWGKPSYEWKIKYRLIEEKDDEAVFLIIVDSTKNFGFITYRGSINTCLGRTKKDEKGEWHGTIEWFFKKSTRIKEF